MSRKLLCTLFLLAVCTRSAADDKVLTHESVLVRVRTVKAHGALPRGAAVRQTNVTEISIDRDIQDLASNLEKLPYAHFQLLSSSDVAVPLKKKESVRLIGGQTLAVRPLYCNKERVGIWLDWQDADGTELLNTKLHFDQGESMSLGTDRTEDTGLIYAISVTSGK